MVKVVINIDKLVLEGFDYHNHLRISRAMEQELARLVSENGSPKTGGLPMINAGPINIGQSMGPREVGIQIAQSVFRSFGPKSE